MRTAVIKKRGRETQAIPCVELSTSNTKCNDSLQVYRIAICHNSQLQVALHGAFFSPRYFTSRIYASNTRPWYNELKLSVVLYSTSKKLCSNNKSTTGATLYNRYAVSSIAIIHSSSVPELLLL